MLIWEPGDFLAPILLISLPDGSRAWQVGGLRLAVDMGKLKARKYSKNRRVPTVRNILHAGLGAPNRSELIRIISLGYFVLRENKSSRQ